MNEAKFTPSPWWLTHNNEWVIGIDESVGTTCVAVGVYDTHNAHLIASAPEMYELLEGIMGEQRELQDERPCCLHRRKADEIEALLKKARGEEI